MPKLLRIPKLITNPIKGLVKIPSFKDHIGLSKSYMGMQKSALDDIIDCIKTGKQIPEKYYRASTVPDILLASDGILHLHLGNPKTKELLYLQQYDSHIVLLEINNHYHFTTDPKGETLKRMHGAKIDQWNSDQEQSTDPLPSTPDQPADKNAAIRSRMGLPKKNESFSFPLMRELIRIVFPLTTDCRDRCAHAPGKTSIDGQIVLRALLRDINPPWKVRFCSYDKQP